jgi:putative endonuclease
MVVVAQLVRASVCGTEGRGFEPHLPPKKIKPTFFKVGFFYAPMKYFVYILFSSSTNKHYIGQTNNLENRLQRHNSGTEKYTKTGTTWMLKHSVSVESRAEAMRLEKKLKNFKSNKLLNEWISKSRGVGSE